MTDTLSFDGRLLPNERVLWAGRPATGILLTARDAFLIPFSLLWCGIVSVVAVGLPQGGGAPSNVAGVAFLLFGLFMLFGRFALDAWLRSRTRYAVTDKRVLVFREGPFSSFTALSLDRLPQAQLRDRRNSRGDIRFGPQQALFGFGRTGFSMWLPTLDPTPQFLAIADARGVFDMLQQASLKSA